MQQGQARLRGQRQAHLIRSEERLARREKRVIAEINALRQRIVGGENLRTDRGRALEDPGTPKKGGAIGWMSLAELDPYFANQVSE